MVAAGGPVEEDGQAALSRALRAFVEAASLPEGPERAQRILLGNLLIGAHEQYRLQAQIVGALDKLREAARTAGRPEVERFAEALVLHAQTEERVLYPAAILAGELVALQLEEKAAA